jgi:hypothetical protein
LLLEGLLEDLLAIGKSDSRDHPEAAQRVREPDREGFLMKIHVT